MASMFGSPSLPSSTVPPVAPTINDADVAAKTDAALKNERLRQGKASTILTDPKAQRTAQATMQTYLTGL